MISLSLVFSPLVPGYICGPKVKSLRNAGKEVGATGGILMILGAIISGFAANAATLGDREILPESTIVSVIIVAPMGFLAIHNFKIFSLRPANKAENIITICLETGIQKRSWHWQLSMYHLAIGSDSCFSSPVFPYMLGPFCFDR